MGMSIGRVIRACCVEPERRRLRAWLRLVLQSALAIAAVIVAWTLGGLAGSGEVGHAIGGLAQVALVVVATLACARWIDRRPLQELVGVLDRRAGWELLLGVGIGATVIGGVALLDVLSGAARYVPAPLSWERLAQIAPVSLFFVGVAIEEELWFRGYQLTNLSEGFSGRLERRSARALALAVSSALFGLAHAMNPHASVASTVNVAMAGALLGLTFALTGRLWLAIGLHFSWNTAQALLGMAVSGQDFSRASLFERSVEGAAWWTGGEFGPEAGASGLSAMLVATLACGLHARWALRRGAPAAASNLEAERGS